MPEDLVRRRALTGHGDHTERTPDAPTSNPNRVCDNDPGAALGNRSRLYVTPGSISSTATRIYSLDDQAIDRH